MIKGNKTKIRPLRKEDFPNIFRWVNDPGIMQFWYGRDKQRSMEWIKKHFTPAIEGKTDWTYWVIETNNKPIGYMCNTVEKDDDGEFIGKVEIDILIGEKEMQEKGYGPNALKAMINYAFKTQKAERVFLVPRLTNSRAIHVYQKVGFKKEGTLRHYEKFEGRWVDNLMMSVLKDEYKK
ncbi:GNAT family N-acetyltransferase [Candidatus Gottesmanbacteria bacterium]|nr:GNAT family N-acetyltransferase [Candidatus Gottesmanbacteria bacterium]